MFQKLLLTLTLLCLPLAAQTKINPDCVIPFSFTATGSTSNLTCGNNTLGIASWIVIYSSTGFSAVSVVVQSAPDVAGVPGSWGTFGGTVLTTSQYPGSSGVNPNTAITSANTGLAGYFPWMRVTLASVTGSGTVKGSLYGFLNSTIAKANSGGGGGGGGPTILGTANQITVTGAGCTTGSTSTCTISIPSNAAFPGAPTTTTAALGDSSTKIATTAFISNAFAGCTFTIGSFSCPGSISSGVGSGATGALDVVGSTSAATSTVTIDATNPGTTVKLPNDATSGLYAATSPTATPAAGCAQFSGTGTQATSTGVACGSGGGGSAGGGVLGYSASALTLPVAGTIFLSPVGGALPSATESNVSLSAPAAAAISNFYVALSLPPGTGNTITFTWRVAGSSSTLTCPIADGATSCSDTTHSFTPVVGDLLSVQIVTTGTVVIAPLVRFVAEYGVTGGGGGTPGGSNGQWQTNNSGAFGGLTGTSIIPTAGWTLQNSAVLNNFSNAQLGVLVLNNGSLNWRFITRALPAGSTYTIAATIDGLMASPAVDSQSADFGLSDGTKYENYQVLSQASGNNPSNLRIETITNVTTDNATVFGPTSGLTGRLFSVCIVEDGVHRTWFHYSNGSWVQDLQETTGTFLTPMLLAVGGLSANSSNSNMTQVNLKYLFTSTGTSCP